MPELMSPGEVQIWKNRLVRALKARKPHLDKWRRILDAYEGNYFDEQSDLDRYCVNWIFTITRQTVCQLYYQNPRMNFRPLSMAGEFFAPIMEDVIQYERRAIQAEGQERLVLADALICGTGILKVGFNAEYGLDPAYADTKGNIEEHIRADSSLSMTDAEDSEDTVGPLTERNYRVMGGHPWVKRIAPWNYLIDPDAAESCEARWECHKFSRPWVDVVRDSRYDKEARSQLGFTGKGRWLSEHLDGAEDTDPQVEDSAMVNLYEVYDRERQRILVFDAAMERPLMVQPFPFYMPEGPYVKLQFFPRSRDDFWAISHADTYMLQVQTLNKLRSRMMDHLDRWGSIKALVAKGKMSPADIEAFCNQPANTIAEILIDHQDDIRKIVQIFPQLQISQDAWKLADMFWGDLQQVSGVSEIMMGSGAQVNTATEASYLQQQGAMRIADMRYTFERFLASATARVVQLLQQYWPAEKVVPIVGPDGQNWAMLNVPDYGVRSEYEVDIEAGSTERYDKNVRVRQTIDAMRELLPLEQALNAHGYSLNLPELVKNYIRNTELARNPDRMLVQLQPQPQQPGMPMQGGMGGGMGQGPPLLGQPQMMPTGIMPSQEGGFESGRAMSEANYTGMGAAA